MIDEPGLIRTYPEVFQFIEGQPSAVLDDTRLGVFAQDSWRAGEHVVLLAAPDVFDHANWELKREIGVDDLRGGLTEVESYGKRRGCGEVKCVSTAGVRIGVA